MGFIPPKRFLLEAQGTTRKRDILPRFSDKRPNRSHLRGAPKTKMA